MSDQSQENQERLNSLLLFCEENFEQINSVFKKITDSLVELINKEKTILWQSEIDRISKIREENLKEIHHAASQHEKKLEKEKKEMQAENRVNYKETIIFYQSEIERIKEIQEENRHLKMKMSADSERSLIELEKYQCELKKILNRLEFIVDQGELTCSDTNFIEYTNDLVSDLIHTIQEKIDRGIADLKQKQQKTYGTFAPNASNSK
jgi:hypothetical protein